MKIETDRQGTETVLRPVGRLDVDSASEFLRAVDAQLRDRAVETLRVDIAGLDYIDSAGAAVLIEGYHRAKECETAYTLRHLTDAARRIFALTDGGALLANEPVQERFQPGIIERIGAVALGAWHGMGAFLQLLSGTIGVVLSAPFRRRAIRWDMTFLYMERTGWDAVPIVSVIGLLIGIVLALQSAIQLERYGALIFVADLVAVSLTRELGPLMTAIVVAGRSGSAFAAEIGTMKVNEEIDALKTMGLSSVEFLVVPKFTALLIMMPCLVIFMNGIGIFGGFLVGVGHLGIAPGVYYDETVQALHVKDIVTGLIKSVVFAGLIAATGCFRGFEVEGGADGVGRKTTSSVVTSIFLVILADALFTALFYAME